MADQSLLNPPTSPPPPTAPEPPPAAPPTSPPPAVPPFQPATATAAQAQVTNYRPEDYTVGPQATVQSQIADIIAKGSPLLEQAQGYAREQANKRGILSSTMAIQAGQRALYDVATPIAAADAATYAQAGRDTTTARNAALAFGADAANKAGLQDAALLTQTSLASAGAKNTYETAIATERERGVQAMEVQRSVADTQKDIAALQADTTLTVEERRARSNELIAEAANLTQTSIANIQRDTALSVEDKRTQTNLAIANLQDLTARYVEQLRSSTTLTAQEIVTQSNEAIAAGNNATAKIVEQMRAEASISAATIQAAAASAAANAQAAASVQVARINADTNLTVNQQRNATDIAIANANNASQAFITSANNATSVQIATIQADTSLTVQQRHDQVMEQIAAAQNTANTNIEAMRINGTLTVAGIQADISERNNLSAQAIAQLQADTSISVTDRNNQTVQLVEQMRIGASFDLEQLQQEGRISLQDKAAGAQAVLIQLQGDVNAVLEGIRGNNALALADKQGMEQRLLATLQGGIQTQVQEMVNAGNLANIAANGEITLQVTQLQNDNRALLQTSAGASQLYAQTLQNLSNIMMNPDMPYNAKQVAMNNQMALLQNGMATFSQVANTPDINLDLQFGASGAMSAAESQATATQLYQELLGRAPDPGGLAWASQAIATDGVEAVRAIIMASPEYMAANG